jgi:hypothetical protein
MGLEEIAVCDVYRTTKQVRRYKVVVTRTVDDLNFAPLIYDAYLCPRALERLNAFIEHGMKPPSERKRTAKEIVTP